MIAIPENDFKYAPKAGPFALRTHLRVSTLKSVRTFQQANRWEANLDPVFMGNLQPPILWNNSAKRIPS